MIIETKRCLIRLFSESDIDDFMTYRNNMEWMKYQGFKGLTKKEYEDALLGTHLADDGIQLAVICKQSNSLIGDVYIKREGNTYWIGYTINPEESRKGYAHEVACGVIEELKRNGAVRIKAGIETGNTASLELIKKLGFVYECSDGNEEIFVLNL